MPQAAAAKALTWLYVILLPLCLGIYTSCQGQQQKQQATGEYTYQKPSSGGTGKVYLGREIAAMISPAGGAWLARETREEEDHALQAIANMELRPNSVVADIGAGVGFYTLQIAPKVPEGKVYAVEVQDAFVKTLQDRKQELGLTNMEVVKGGTKTTNLPANSLDLAFMVDVYHELEYPREVLQDIYRALKPDGILLLLEYRAEDPDLNVKELHKMSAAQVKKELEANGFILYRQGNFLPRQHFIMFRKAAK